MRPARSETDDADARPGRLVAWTLVTAVAAGGVFLVVDRPSIRVLAAIAVASAATAWLNPRLWKRVRVAVDAVAARLGRVVATLVMVPVAGIVLLLWAVHRLFRHDPLHPPTGSTSRWVRRVGADRHPDRFYAGVPIVDATPLTARLSRAGSAIVIVILIAAAVVVVGTGGTPDGGAASVVTSTVPTAGTSQCTGSPDGGAEPGEAAWARLLCDQQAAMGAAEFTPSATFRLADFASATVNVHDGERRTWRAPPCQCERRTVWWFGGSAAWGFYQRDDHSLASQVARLAWEQGLALDIVNLAMPAYTFGQGVRLFGERSVSMEPPDMVVFLDGGNDLVLQAIRAAKGAAHDASEVVLMEEALDDLLRNGIFLGRPGEVSWTGRDPASYAIEDLAPDAIAATSAATSQRYRRNLELARRLAEAADVPVTFMWQPLSVVAPPATRGAAGDSLDQDPKILETVGRVVTDVRASLPAEVVDLSTALDQSDEKVFVDIFHLTESGAGTVAAAVLPAMLRAAADSGHAWAGG